MIKRFSLAAILCLILSTVALAQVVPTPPKYVLDKQLPGEDPFSIARPTFDSTGAHVAAFIHGSRTLTVWDTKTGKVVAEIPEAVHKFDGVDGLEFSTTGKNLLMIRKDLPLTYVEWATGKVVKEVPLKADPKKVYSYAFSPQQDLVAVGTDTGVALWDLKAGKKLTSYLSGQPVSGLDMLYYTDPKTKNLVRLLAYAKALVPPNTTFKDVAGLVDLDSGKITTLLNDVPADKKIEGKMTFTTATFEYGGSHLLISTMVFPPTVQAGSYLVDTWTGKFKSYLNLGEKTVGFRTQYLSKPYFGFVISSQDMSQPTKDFGVSTEFIVPTKEGLKVLDTVKETELAVQSIAIDAKSGTAAVVVKKNQADPAKLFLYKIQPKK